MSWQTLSTTFSATAAGLLLAGGGIVWVVLFLLARRQPERKRLLWRMIASAVAILSLVLLLLQPQWAREPRPSAALLITPGTDLATPLDRANHEVLARSSHTYPTGLADTVEFDEHVFAFGAIDRWRKIFPKVKAIPDAAWLQRHAPEIRTLYVTGYGLSPDDLDPLRFTRLIPVAAAPEPGVVHIDWPRQIPLGQAMRVQGLVHFATGDTGAYRLELADLTGPVESVEIVANNDTAFTLEMTPRTTGPQLFRLELKRKTGESMWQEILDVAVTAPERLSVLMIQSSPSFETRFLKEWLATNGNSLAIRTTISKERYRFEFVNSPEHVFGFERKFLQRFDVLLIDMAVLVACSRAEMQALQEATSKDGLGVLIIADEAFAENSPRARQPILLNGFGLKKIADRDERLVRPIWPGQDTPVTTELSAAAVEFRDAWGLRPLVRDTQDRSLVVSRYVESGIVGVTALSDTYRWMLDGNAAVYARYWSYVLGELTRRGRELEQWLLPAQPVFVDAPLQLRLFSPQPRLAGVARIGALAEAPERLALRQDPSVAEQWSATYWPVRTGWHAIATASGRGAPVLFYVFENTRWQALQQAQKNAATARFAVLGANRVSEIEKPRVGRAEPISPFWFFLGFVLSCGYLWLERKLSRRRKSSDRYR